jgi:hypothetical protein
MKLLFVSLICASVGSFGCAKHDCKLDAESDKADFGEVAEMTKGAFSCYPANGELVASFGDEKVENVATKYKTFLESKSWKVEVREHQGKRSNGESYDGKMILATSGDKKLGVIVYPLSDKLIETVIARVKDDAPPKR